MLPVRMARQVRMLSNGIGKPTEWKSQLIEIFRSTSPEPPP
jgi:hypothetical protein